MTTETLNDASPARAFVRNGIHDIGKPEAT